jgi:hypothetical protein
MAPERGPASSMTPDVASNYVFVTATSASLIDMSSGTTTLLASNIDDTASPLTNIGFDFFFQGTRFTQFSINDNGVLRLGASAQTGSPYKPLAQANLPVITAYGADQRTHTSGKVHFKATGTPPNRVLVVEWLNNQSTFNSGGTADLTYQVRLYETTGLIELVYGGMTMSTAGAADTNSKDPNIGFSSSNTAGTVGSVTAPQSGTPDPTFNGTSATAVANTYVAGSIPVLSSAANGSRRIFSFAPPVPTAPTALTFAPVSAGSMTLNWSDSPDELGYAIYRSTDGVSYVFDGAAAQNATSYAANGLAPATNYFWRVFAVSEGALSTALAGTQATNPPGNITSVQTGNWNDPNTWGGSVPTVNDNATIANGHTVTINATSSALTVTVQSGGALEFEAATARTFTVAGSVTIASGGAFRSAATGTQTGHVLSIGGNLTNNGTVDFSTNSNTAGAGITFTGATSNTFGGTGGTTNVRTITINKGTAITNVLELSPTNFTVRGATIDSATANYLTLTNGTFKISGTFTANFRTFSAAAYTIPTTCGFWLNNPNYTVTAQAGNAVNNGQVLLSQGTFNQGTLASHSFRAGTAAVFTIDGGTLNCAGQFSPQNAVTYNQSGGTVNVGTVGNSQSNFGTFELFSASAIFNMTGGTINIVQASTGTTQIDYQNLATVTNASGTLNVGTAATATKFTFTLRGNIPNLVIDNTTNNKTATATAQVNLRGTTTINAGTTMVINGQVCLVIGPTFTNNGTLTGTATNTRFYFAGGSGATTYTGSGVVTVPLTAFEVDNIAGVTIDPATVNPVVTSRFNNFSGGLIGSGKLTLGNGGTTSAVVQLGVAGPTQAVSGFDVPPTFNPGSGGMVNIYAPELTARTTGNELPASRSITTLTLQNTNGVILAGGDLTVSGVTTFTAANLTTGANTLIVGPAGSVSRTTGHVIGNLRKSYTAAGTKTFEVGTANGYSPVAANVTAGTFPASFTAKAAEGQAPYFLGANALQRFWTLTATGITADLTFTYLPTDVVGTPANYKFIKNSAGSVAVLNPTSAPTTTSAAIAGVSSFSDWTLGQPSANANLADLVLSNGTLDPAFSAGITAYTANVPFAVNSITVTPTVADGSASVTVNGNPVTSGSPSDPVALNQGSNIVTTVVTAQDGTTTKTYTVDVTRAAPTYTLTYTAGAHGSISGTSPQIVPQGGDGSAVTAVPDTGYHFVNWSDASTANPRTDMNVMGDIAVTANFAINTYTLTYNAGANGSISGTSPQMVNHGDSGTPVTAVPNTGYHFVDWSDASTANPRTDTNVMSDVTVTANFAINEYTLTYNAGAHGSISGTSPQMVNHGDSGTPVTAVADSGYEFVDWSDSSTANPRTDTNVTANITVAANFAASASNNANLSNLVLSAGAIQPAFDSNTVSYTLTVPTSTTTTTVTPTAADGSATITVNGQPVASGAASAPISLSVGDNTITTVVTAQDGVTMKTYTVTVHRTGPVTTNSGSGLAPDYPSLAAAINALNTASITSPVVITLNGNETAPAGGFAITQSSSTSANTITIQGNSSTITASSALTVGALNDAIFKLIGAKWVTIQNFTMQENAANTVNTPAASNNMTEWGVALLYANVTTGSQNNTIQNNTISLNRTYLNTFGIYSNTRHSATNVTTAADATAATGANNNNKIYGNTISNVNDGIVLVGASTTSNMDTGNDIGGSSATTGNSITNWGGGSPLSGYVSVTTSNFCIFLNHQLNDNASFNTITSAPGLTTTTVQHGGVLKAYSTAPAAGTVTTTNLNNNTVTLADSPTTAQITGVTAQGMTALSTATININNNLISGSISGASATSATFVGILGTSGPGALNINGNTVRGVTSTATTGGFIGIQQQTNGVVNTLNINNNKIGDTTAGAVMFSAATSGSVGGLAVTSTGAASTCALSVSNNDVRGIVQSTAGSGAHSYIGNGASTLTTNINGNMFTNLTANTTGSVTFIANSVTRPANAVCNVNNNAIVTAFTKSAAGGTVRFYDSFGTTPATGSETNTGNNFSNVTLTGATTLDGWRTADGSTSAPFGPGKTVTNNTFTNITAGTSAITSIMTVGYSNTGLTTNNVSGNTFSSISGGGAITILTSPTASQNFFNNTINGVSSSGASAVNAMTFTGGVTQNVSKNKIYDLSGSNAGSTVNGILVSTVPTTINIFDNLIGDLRTPAASATNPINGINITSSTATTTLNVSFNTIYLNASSTGANFGSSGISAAASATATSAALNLRNNVIVNTSTPSGTGVTVAYRRSGTSLSNYGAPSNNNDFYAGAPGAARLIFFDGTNSDQSIAAYKARVTTRDSASFTENPTFLSTNGSSANFLHIDPAVATHLESGGAPVSGITDDFDGDARNASTPDVGADEFNGTSLAFNANLSNLVLSDGTLAPAFDPNTTSYTAMVPNSTTSITETPTAADATSTITVNGTPVASGTASGAIPLAVGPNTITTVVTAQDGMTTKTYTVTVTRAALVLPSIAINDVTVNEADGNAVFTVTQSATSGTDTTFLYSTADGSAVAPGDYTAATAQMGTITAGNQTTTITIPIVDDNVYEHSETFTVTLGSPTNATISDDTGTGTITDNDPQPTFSIDSVSHNEGNSGQTAYVFTVTKNGMSGQGSSVQFTTADGTATTANGDYVANSGTLTFTAAETSKQITVQVAGDKTVEPNETFTVQLTNIMNDRGEHIEGTLPAGTGTIVNDDNAPVTDPVSDTTNQNTTKTVTLSATDLDGDALSFSIVATPLHGTLGSISSPICASGSCTATVDYTPNPTYSGPDNFTYQTNDGTNDGNTATVSMTVVHVLPAVTNTNDSGANSLRQALLESEDNDTIVFNLPAGPHTITLATELPVAKNVVIPGPANGALTISGGGVTRAFHVLVGKTVRLEDMTIANGNAAGGGAVQNDGDLAIVNCTLSDNTSTADGGAIRNDGTLRITNSTLSGNGATVDGGAILNGVGRTLSMGSVTLVKNTADGNGGGINSAGAVTLRNSIIALNTATTGRNILNAGGTVTSAGYNLSDDSAGGALIGTGDQIDTDPILGPLKNNGGLSFTHAPLSNSTALDRGKDLDANGAPTGRDQRGTARPVTYLASIAPPIGGDRSDIGAVEVPAGVNPTSAVSRKTHGSAGDFDINLPFTGVVGVECRSGGATNDYKMIVTFAGPVTFTSAAVTHGTGTVSSAVPGESITDGGVGSPQITINLTGVTNAQRLTVGIFGVSDGANTGDVGVRMGIALGDTTNNGMVNGSDISETKAQSGMPVTSSNFRNDVTANGVISSSDLGLVKAQAGVDLPPIAAGPSGGDAPIEDSAPVADSEDAPADVDAR